MLITVSVGFNVMRAPKMTSRLLIHFETSGSGMQHCYEVLGLTSAATVDEIKEAFRARAVEAHPDKGGTADQFRTLQEAYAQLMDPMQREIINQRIVVENNSMDAGEALEATDFDHLESSTSHAASCRCGGQFIVSRTACLPLLVRCNGCSMVARVESLPRDSIR